MTDDTSDVETARAMARLAGIRVDDEAAARIAAASRGVVAGAARLLDALSFDDAPHDVFRVRLACAAGR